MSGAGSLPESLSVFRELGIQACALADLDFAANQAVQHGLIARGDEDLRECLNQIRAMANKDPAITLDGNGRPRSNKNGPAGNKKPAVVFWKWAASPDALPVAENLHRKLRHHKDWLWTGSDIEHHLGLTGPKSISSWVPYRQRLAGEPFAEVVSDHERVTALVQWLRPGSAPA